MPQYGRPSTDTVNESWTEDDGTAVTIFDQINEVTVDDVNYIQSALAPTSDVYATKLTTVEDPVSSTGHIVRYRYAKSAAGGATIDLTVQLRQGYVSEASQGTLIKSWTHAAVSETLITQTQTLIAAEADAITNYADLFLRFVANQV